jgi:hypothetical protein
MFANKSEVYQAGWTDYVNDNGCNLPDDLDYMEGWEDSKEALFECEMEEQLELQQELYELEHYAEA